MSESRNWVEAILYGGGGHRRFTQDGPVLPDVWTQYLEESFVAGPEQRVAVLIEPHFDSGPTVIAKRMKERLGDAFDATQTVYNRTIVSSWLRFAELIRSVVPLTRWYADIAAARAVRDQTEFDGSLPSKNQMWDDLIRSEREGYPFTKLLAFVRISGVIAYCNSISGSADRGAAKLELAKAIVDLLSRDEKNSREGREQLAKIALEGWTALLGNNLPDPPGKSRTRNREGTSPIYAINRNREVSFALTYSVKTVKADAAKRLFDVDCSGVTWAVIDSGIDATHPAFMDHEALDDK